MCGFAGYLYLKNTLVNDDEQRILLNMGHSLRHRGPDDSGLWKDSESGIGLVHQRLSIIDLTDAGHQPMKSVSERYILVFNGEIYNHKDLRAQLLYENKRCSWVGNSDTETLIDCIDFWGLEKTLKSSNGMFALALWDKKTRTLSIARDRFGEKPLNFGWQGSGKNTVFLFASELEAIRCHPSFVGKVNLSALSNYLKNNYVGSDYSIYQGISKLKPGCLLTVSRERPAHRVSEWFSTISLAEKGVNNRYNKSAESAVNELERLLSDSVNRQMVSDAPLGAFLSGGVDSSTIVSLMQKNSSQRVKTFSIGFNENEYNEAEHAKLVAKHLCTEHSDLYVSAKNALDVIPNLPNIYSEPFADSSQIPTFLLSKLASTDVKVCLSGDAGDELFSGYNRYRFTNLIWKKIKLFPIPLRKLAARFILSIPEKNWDYIGKAFSYSRLGDKLYKGSFLLDKQTVNELYNSLISFWHDPNGLLEETGDLCQQKDEVMSIHWTANDIEKMMLYDIVGYLPDDILTKVDRASMSVGLETRIPFLDPDIVQFAWSLPLDFKIRRGATKWPLRQILYKYVPKNLIERPKMGFGVPLGAWLRGPLREWGESLIDKNKIKNEGFFKPEIIERKWLEHQTGTRNWQYQLWGVLMFQAWLSEVN